MPSSLPSFAVALLTLANLTLGQVTRDGLQVELDADVGVHIEDDDRVVRWVNQVGASPITNFVQRDEGRETPGSGRPRLVRSLSDIGRHDAVVFARQELVNHEEDALDHLITGAGYTWFAVLRPDRQVLQLEDVNSFFGNLRNGGNYEGIWGNLTDDDRVWIGSRNAVTFGRWDENNPMVVATEPLSQDAFHVVAGRMGKGVGTVVIELYVDSASPVASEPFPVNEEADSSKLVIGQERDATNHPGWESFDGALARFLLYDRPLADDELRQTMAALRERYEIAE